MIVLNKLFTQTTFKQLFDEFSNHKTYIDAVQACGINTAGKTNTEVIAEIYEFMRKSYRNEYFYKNTMLHELALEENTPYKPTALTEIPIGKSKADFIVLGDKAIVYEIKTGLDTFERLETQLSDYYKAFQYVAIVTDEKNKDVIVRKLKGTPTGIYLMNENDKLVCVKEPIQCENCLSVSELFRILNQKEYKSILLELFGSLPNVPPVRYYTECRKLFCSIPISVTYPLFCEALKARSAVSEAFRNVPYELKALVYFAKHNSTYYDDLERFLTSDCFKIPKL